MSDTPKPQTAAELAKSYGVKPSTVRGWVRIYRIKPVSQRPGKSAGRPTKLYDPVEVAAVAARIGRERVV